MTAIAAVALWLVRSPAGRALLAASAVLAVLAWGHHDGASRARRAAAQATLSQEIETRRTRDAVEMDVARQPDPAAELQREWAR